MDILALFYQAESTYVQVFQAILRYLVPVITLLLLWRCIRPLLTFRREPEIWAWLCLEDGRKLPITHWENIIGRHRRSDIVINFTTISKSHAVLTRYDDGRWVVTDSDSSTGIVVNGKKIKLKGVNRHECSPTGGRTVTLEDMLADVRLMKRYNIDTVRTSHYPDHHLWYDICDLYGIYLVAEANVEAHEPGYGEKGLGLFKEWNHSIVERNQRHVVFYRNNPSVVMWSMGNETGHGDCFRNALAETKRLDPTRPRHWERGNPDADVDSSMYPAVEWLEARGRAGDGLAAMPAKWNTKTGNFQTVGKAVKPVSTSFTRESTAVCSSTPSAITRIEVPPTIPSERTPRRLLAFTRRSSFSTQIEALNSLAFWMKKVAGRACRPI